MHKKTIVFIVTAFIALTAAAKEGNTSVQVNDNEVRRWNAFADSLYRLHRQQLTGRKLRETEQLGGYAGLPEFYREVSYYDADTGRLLSRIQWERAQAERIHSIEVYVYGADGRLARDYLAWYLPDARNAPRQTAVNLHHYAGELHGWRQFDASGNRIYEKCSRVPDEKPLFDLSGEDRIAHAEADPRSVVHSGEYRRCFGSLPKTAGAFLQPH